MSRFIVVEKAASMPNTCWGRYRKIAVLEVEDGVTDAKMISSRAKGVKRVVRIWNRLHLTRGYTFAWQAAVCDSSCAAAIAYRDAEALVAELNT